MHKRSRARWPEKALDFLTAARILSADQVVESQVRLLTAPRERAVAVRVFVDDSPACLVKLARPGSRLWVRSELECYRVLARSGLGDRVAPGLLGADPHLAILAVRLLDPATTLHDRLIGEGFGTGEIPGMLGQALAELHVRTQDAALPARLPWIMRNETESSATDPGATERIRAFLGRSPHPDALERALLEARACWQPRCLIHGDLKWDNCLLAPRPVPVGGPGVLLVDWELGACGDPAWDVATVIQEFLILGAPQSSPGGDLCQVSEEWRGPVKAFLSRYQDTLGGRPREWTAFIARTARYAGVRLIQTAWELTAIEDTFAETSGPALSLAVELCRKPERMSAELHRLADT